MRPKISANRYARALRFKDCEWAKRIILLHNEVNNPESKFNIRWKENKKIQTPAERCFQNILKTSIRELYPVLGALYWKKEFPVFIGDHYFFLDFVVFGKCRIAFEIDGGIHNHKEQYDLKRDLEIMRQERIVIVRIPNERVLSHAEETKRFVKTALEARAKQTPKNRSGRREKGQVCKLWAKTQPTKFPERCINSKNPLQPMVSANW